jgi:hypothetical protein
MDPKVKRVVQVTEARSAATGDHRSRCAGSRFQAMVPK